MKTLIQASTLNALMLGNFDETVSVKDFLHTPIPVSVPTPGWTARPSLRTAWPTRPPQTARSLS